METKSNRQGVLKNMVQVEKPEFVTEKNGKRIPLSLVVLNWKSPIEIGTRISGSFSLQHHASESACRVGMCVAIREQRWLRNALPRTIGMSTWQAEKEIDPIRLLPAHTPIPVNSGHAVAGLHSFCILFLNLPFRFFSPLGENGARIPVIGRSMASRSCTLPTMLSLVAPRCPRRSAIIAVPATPSSPARLPPTETHPAFVCAINQQSDTPHDPPHRTTESPRPHQ